MINKETLDILYNAVLLDKELTTKELNSYGFTSNDLTKMVKNGTLNRVKRGLYKFIKVDFLYVYGKKLITLKDNEKANYCFKKCYEIDSSYSNACFQLFLKSIKEKNYELAFKYFEELPKNNLHYRQDYNMYLYLLNIITDVPEKYKEVIDKFTFQDLRVCKDDYRYKNVWLQNKIRYAIFKKNISHAIKLIDELPEYTVQGVLINTLLIQAKSVLNKYYKQLLYLLKEKRYQEAVELIKEKVDYNNIKLNKIDCYILKLLYVIIGLENNCEFPLRKTIETDDIYYAIDTRNYDLARKINEKYLDENNKSINALNILLNDICKMQLYSENNISKETQNEIKDEKNEIEKNVVLIDNRITENERNFIKSIYDKLIIDKGFILLKPMSDEDRKNIHKIVEEYEDMDSFSIGEGLERRVVLKYRAKVEEKIDVKETIAKARAHYDAENYKDSIELYLKLINILKKSNSFLYACLGFAYMNNSQKEKAINCFIVSTELAKIEGKDFDYSPLIAKLKGIPFSFEEKKPFVKMDLKDFEKENETNYGINNLEEITEYIRETNLDVESACLQLGMNEEQINIVRLLYAKGFYAQGNYEKGDEFLKYVERSKNKSQFLKQMINEIRTNKKFYANRFNEDYPRLSLKMRPKK